MLPTITIVMSSHLHGYPGLSLSLPLLIIYRIRQVLRATPHILTELLYVGSSRSLCFSRPCEGVHRSISLMSSSLLLQQCPTCMVRQTWVVDGRTVVALWGCCLHDLFNIACSFATYKQCVNKSYMYLSLIGIILR